MTGLEDLSCFDAADMDPSLYRLVKNTNIGKEKATIISLIFIDATSWPTELCNHLKG